jgi:hypothetical protein
MKARHTVLVLLALLVSWTARAQHIDPAVIAVSGGFAQTSSVSVSWTVGQTAVETRSSRAGTLSEGFQQAYLTVIPMREKPIPFSLNLYPNPTRSSVLVNMAAVEEDVTLVVHNLLGEAVLRTELRSGDQLTRLSFDALPNGLYMLAAFTNRGERLGLYKIVKAQ